MVQKLPTLPEHLSSPPVISRVRVTRSLVLCVCFVDRCSSFCTFYFSHWVVCSSFSHWVVCSSSIYGFWLPSWYLKTLLRWVDNSGYPPPNKAVREYTNDFCYYWWDVSLQTKTMFWHLDVGIVPRLHKYYKTYNIRSLYHSKDLKVIRLGFRLYNNRYSTCYHNISTELPLAWMQRRNINNRLWWQRNI